MEISTGIFFIHSFIIILIHNIKTMSNKIIMLFCISCMQNCLLLIITILVIVNSWKREWPIPINENGT